MINYVCAEDGCLKLLSVHFNAVSCFLCIDFTKRCPSLLSRLQDLHWKTIRSQLLNNQKKYLLTVSFKSPDQCVVKAW